MRSVFQIRLLGPANEMDEPLAWNDIWRLAWETLLAADSKWDHQLARRDGHGTF